MRSPKMTIGPVCLWLSRLLLGVGACFNFVGTNERLSHTDHVRCMIWDYVQIKRGGCMACCSGFPLQGVHRLKSSRLSDMSNCLFVAVITQIT
jgi:hypothetical protein